MSCGDNLFDGNMCDANELVARHADLLDELEMLEREFKTLKESLFVEKFHLLEGKIEELRSETALELVELGSKLDAIKRNKATSQKFRRRFRINSVWNEYLSEIYSFERAARIDRHRVRERLREDLLGRIAAVDRQLARLSGAGAPRPRATAGTHAAGSRSTGHSDDSKTTGSKRLTLIDKLNQRKIVPISPDSPYIVYNLDEDKIEEDLSRIPGVEDRSGVQGDVLLR